MLLSLFSSFSVFDYAAMSRNYGISMLLVFLIVLSWERGMRNGMVLGLLFALLANTNVHSVVLVGGFFSIWSWRVRDLLCRHIGPLRRPLSLPRSALFCA